MLGWSALLQWSRIGINAASFVVFMRWLSLESIGNFALAQAPVLAIVGILQAAVPDAVIQNEQETAQNPTKFVWTTLLLSVVASILLLFYALTLSWFGKTRPALYASVLSILPLVSGASLVAEGSLRRRLATRELALRTLFSSCLALALGFAAVIYLPGAWALVIYVCVSAISNSAVTLWLAPPSVWGKPSRATIADDLSLLIVLGSRYALSSIAWPLIQAVGTWNLGPLAGGMLQISNRVFTLLDAISVSPLRYVLLPIFNRSKKDRELKPETVADAISTSLLLASPVFLGAAATLPVLLPLLIGKANASEALHPAQLLCIYGPFVTLSSVVSLASTSMGYATSVLRRSFVLFVLVIVPTCFLSNLNVTAMVQYYALGGAALNIFAAYILLRLHFSTTVKAYLASIGAPIFCASGMALLVYLLVEGLINRVSPVLLMLLSVAFGILVYFSLLRLCCWDRTKSALRLINSKL